MPETDPHAPIAYCTAIAAALFFALSPSVCPAQSLHGLKIGDEAAALTRLASPAETANDNGMSVRRWTLPNGNSFSVTLSRNGRIIYLESDWNGANDDTGCDLPGLHFGATTLTELRKRLGSNGFAFKARGGILPTPDGIVMINSYEVGSAIVTFYSRINQEEYQRAKASIPNASPADYARLDGISIADETYAKKAGWGPSIFDPNYKKPDWK
ncbi:MAG TPA: hypothetical protein VN612_07050 [Acidobacteriaceae bacterium]|nr:hypothetical protein [Acidobacteriaceae bacterium]